MSGAVAICAGAGQAAYRRSCGPGTTTESLLVDASLDALADAELSLSEVDGFGVCSFTMGPDHAIDMAWRLGLRLNWVMQDTSGGASGANMLQHATRAIEAGDASCVLLVAGDRMLNRAFVTVNDHYSKVARDHLRPIPYDGPNTVFSALTQLHMRTHGLVREDYGWIAISQRRWAGGNPGAIYRRPLTMEEYLDAPPVAPPLHRYDCVPIISGADAIVVCAADRIRGTGAAVRAVRGRHNHDLQEGDGLRTGLADLAPELWAEAGLRPEDLDLACLYDDYPVLVLIQAADLGLMADGDLRRFARRRLGEEGWPLNTSGGQLSAGQAGSSGALHGLVEATRQLRGRAGERQVPGARTAVVSGYGMVIYRYGACANAAVLERFE